MIKYASLILRTKLKVNQLTYSWVTKIWINAKTLWRLVEQHKRKVWEFEISIMENF
jgi:hypothetical protein